jgi:REP element-mobilizing transposase RayT
MPSTHLSIHPHIIFSTKEREPFIRSEWKEDLHGFLGGAIRRTGCIPEAVGGTSDHVHLLTGLKAVHATADVVRDIKSASSRWFHDDLGYKQFGWQDDYGAFSVSASHIDRVKRYIANQEKKHRKCDFKEEYVDFLHKYGIEYDERFLW